MKKFSGLAWLDRNLPKNHQPVYISGQVRDRTSPMPSPFLWVSYMRHNAQAKIASEPWHELQFAGFCAVSPNPL